MQWLETKTKKQICCNCNAKTGLVTGLTCWFSYALKMSNLISGLNKYKKRHFSKTVNLWTGETDVHPDLIKVCTCIYWKIILQGFQFLVSSVFTWHMRFPSHLSELIMQKKVSILAKHFVNLDVLGTVGHCSLSYKGYGFSLLLVYKNKLKVLFRKHDTGF